MKFCLENQRGAREGGKCEVLRPCHPPKFGTCTWSFGILVVLYLDLNLRKNEKGHQAVFSRVEKRDFKVMGNFMFLGFVSSSVN